MLPPIFRPRPDALTRISMAMGCVMLRWHNPDDLFEQAQSAEEVGDIAEVERLYRLLMKSDPTDASARFNLVRNVEAEAALRTAARIDPTFAQAWYNLGDLL